MPARLTPDLVEFVQSGVSVLVGSRDREGRPECQRGMGAVAADDGSTLTVFLNALVARRMVADLGDNGAIAITFSRPIDHRTVQVKGRVTEIRDAAPGDRAAQERYLAAFVEQLYLVGMPRAISRRLRLAPGVAVDVAVSDVFVQTPGPGAGRRWDAR